MIPGAVWRSEAPTLLGSRVELRAGLSIMLTSPIQEAPARLVSVLSAMSAHLADVVAIIVAEQRLTLLSTV